jgi:hypothetical protein
MQVPQFATERGLPQLSVPDFAPHWAPTLAQNWASLCGVQHWLLAVHTSAPPHVPQLDEVRCVPQLSIPDTVPHCALKRAQKALLLSSVHPQWLAVHV